MSSVQLSSAGVAAVAFMNKGLVSQPAALRVCSSRRSVRSLVVKAATVVAPKVYRAVVCGFGLHCAPNFSLNAHDSLPGVF